jgi:hypothetical protein
MKKFRSPRVSNGGFLKLAIGSSSSQSELQALKFPVFCQVQLPTIFTPLLTRGFPPF